MDTTTLFTLALGLQAPWEVKDYRFDKDAQHLELFIDFARGTKFSCPVCGKPCNAYDTEERTWRHMDFFQHKTELKARVPRCKCDEHGVKQVSVPWARPGSGFTLLFEALIMLVAPDMPMAAAADLLREHDTALWRVVHHHVDDARSRVDMSNVKAIGIDETSANREEKFISLVVDMVEKKVLFATAGKDHEVLEAFKSDLETHGGDAKKVKEASLDMSKAFVKGLREYFHQAHLTFDRFHVMKLLGEAVDEVRKNEVKTRPELKRSKYIWLKNKSNLTEAQKTTLSELQKANLKTAEAYRLKVTFQDIYFQCNQEDGEQLMDEWIEMAEASELAPMIRVAQTIKAHKEGILRWFKSGYTNGILEGINSLIQAAKAKARGYRSTRNLIAIVYLIAAKLTFNVAKLWPDPPKARRKQARKPAYAGVIA